MATFDPAWFGYPALALLAATALAQRIDHIRIGLALAALLALVAVIIGRLGAGYILLLAVIVAAHGGIAARAWLRGAAIRFTAEEQDLRDRHFGGLPAAVTRHLMDQGHWITAKSGEVLIRESSAAPCLFYLAEGTATILRDGNDVGVLGDGSLIGEATVLDGTHATGTVLLTSNARLWFIPAAALRDYLGANPEVAGALHQGFARALRGKLASANTRLADRPSLS